MNKLELLSHQEISDIISVLNKTTSVFKECKLFDRKIGEAHLLKYTPVAGGISMTDLFDTSIKSELGMPRVFLKIWIQWNKTDKKLILANKSKLKDFYRYEAGFNDAEISSLEYEARMYQYITDNIILKNVSPNFIPILLNHTCSIDSIIENISSLKSNTFDKLYRKLKIIKTVGDPDIRFIMTGSAPDVMVMHMFCILVNSLGPDQFRTMLDLKRSIKRQLNLSKSEYKAIIFQCFYIFYILHEYRIMHNDTHFSNMLVQLLDEPVIFEININGRLVRFATQYVVKLFDWDRSYREDDGPNDILNYYNTTRTISKFIPNRDFSQFLCQMKDLHVDGFIDILKELVPEFENIVHLKSDNKDTIVIKDVITDEFKQWIIANHERILSKTIENGVQTHTFITISKEELEAHVIDDIEAVKDAVNTKLQDLNGYDNSSVFYFELGFNDLIIIAGHDCYPLFDIKSVDIEKYFKTQEWFDKLTSGFNVPADISTFYRYEFSV